MAFSNSNDYNQSAQTIIKDALLLCGGLEDTENPSADQLSYCMRALNRMIKQWSVKGLKAWCWREETLPLVTGQVSYTIGPTGDLVTERPIVISNVRKVIDGNETPIHLVSRKEYMEQPSKDTSGEPVAAYYDPQLTNGVIYIWQTPTTGMSLKFSSKQYIEDFDTQNDNPYFPVEWLDTIVWNLSANITTVYGSLNDSDFMKVKNKAASLLEDSEGADKEDGSIFLTMEYHP